MARTTVPRRGDGTLENFTRRELNFAETRIGLLKAAMALAGDDGLDSVSVEDLAWKAGVSRMTFFNHFPEKEALWPYFAWTWWFDDSVEQHLDPVRGPRAIRRLFRRIADADSQQRLFFRGFIGHISRYGATRSSLEGLRPGPAEKALLRPDVPAAHLIEVVSLHQQIEQHLREAAEDGMLPGETDGGAVTALVIDLGAALYGEFVMSLVTGGGNMHSRLDRQLDRILGCG